LAGQCLRRAAVAQRRYLDFYNCRRDRTRALTA
jgi:hypothetical protein